MIKIVKHTGEYETYTETVEKENGTTETVEREKEIIEDTKHVDYPDEKEAAAKLLATSWNQDAGYTSDGPHYAVVRY